MGFSINEATAEKHMPVYKAHLDKTNAVYHSGAAINPLITRILMITERVLIFLFTVTHIWTKY